MIITPQLRFPEFTDEWRVERLGDLSYKISDGLHSTPLYDVNGKYFFINGNNIKSGKIIIDDKTKKVSQSEYDKNRKDLDDNTLLLSINGSIGEVALYNSEPVILGKSACYISLNDNSVDKYFIYQQITSSNIQQYFTSELTGSTIKNLSLKTIKDTEIRIPSKKEQQKIATFLTAVDSRAEVLTQKIDQLEAYKRGIMQQLFSQQLRFTRPDGSNFPDWETKKLGEIAVIKTGNLNVQDTDESAEYTFFDRSEDIKKYQEYSFDNEALIYGGEGSEFLPRYFKGKYGLHQRAYTVFDVAGVDMKFLYYFMYTQGNHFLSMAVGSTVKSLRMDCFTTVNVSVPCNKEQQKIAAFLSAIDEKISLTREQLNKTNEFKKGLLQRMFV